MRCITEELKVGDTIKVWWNPKRDTIIRIEPYVGPLKIARNAVIAYFGICRGGMTMFPGEEYEVVNRHA
jgi:hypothetical protein